jgi:hypothetical protein
MSEAGILEVPPGVTVAGCRYRLALGGATTAGQLKVTYGILVAPGNLPSTNQNPETQKHLDWMEWGTYQANYAVGEWKQVNGNGDDGFRTVRSKRKFDGLNTQMSFCLIADVNLAGFSYHLGASVPFLLP